MRKASNVSQYGIHLMVIHYGAYSYINSYSMIEYEDVLQISIQSLRDDFLNIAYHLFHRVSLRQDLSISFGVP